MWGKRLNGEARVFRKAGLTGSIDRPSIITYFPSLYPDRP